MELHVEEPVNLVDAVLQLCFSVFNKSSEFGIIMYLIDYRVHSALSVTIL
jgi:hypothetical protein